MAIENRFVLENKIDIESRIDIEYRNRKTLEIQIKPNGRVRILSPKNASKEWIEKVIDQKRSWIIDALKRIENNEVTAPKLISGERVLAFGNEVELSIGEKHSLIGMTQHSEIQNKKIQMGAAPVELVEEYLIVNTFDKLSRDKTHVKGLLIDWYQKQTYQLVENYVKKWSEVLKVYPKLVRIKDQKKRWGSCSSKGNLNFNWRLSMAPQNVLEYVVVHELCHFHHMNHSKAFWDLVESQLPNYKEDKEWLKENGAKLFWLDDK